MMLFLALVGCLPVIEVGLDTGHGVEAVATRSPTIAVGEHFACTSTRDGDVTCAGDMPAPAGQWWALDASGQQLCGLDAAGFPACWGAEVDSTSPVAQVAAGDAFICTIGLDGDIDCGDVDAPLGLGWHALAARGEVACAISAEDVLVCWDIDGDEYQLGTGRWSLVDVGPDGTVCALATSPTPATGVDCFTLNGHSSGGGHYTALAAGTGWWCATTEDGDITCDGPGAPLDLEAEAGEPFSFAQVDAGADLACGLDQEGRTACWGILPAWL